MIFKKIGDQISRQIEFPKQMKIMITGEALFFKQLQVVHQVISFTLTTYLMANGNVLHWLKV